MYHILSHGDNAIRWQLYLYKSYEKGYQYKCLAIPKRNCACCTNSFSISKREKCNLIVCSFIFSFVKDLSPDKINVSAFRGEGDLSNLQLNEDVLTDLLELPSWIRLTSAWCNHVSFRISWTKLKSVPITLVRLSFYLLPKCGAISFKNYFQYYVFFSHFLEIVELRWSEHNDRNMWIWTKWE